MPTHTLPQGNTMVNNLSMQRLEHDSVQQRTQSTGY